MATIIIGLGNPVLTDDGVGIHAARCLASHLADQKEVSVREMYVGGLELMEAMIGYDRAILIDAIITGNTEPGEFHKTELYSLKQSRNTASNHDASLTIALELGKLLGQQLPGQVDVWAVEAQEVDTFGERMSEPLQRAFPHLIRQLLAEVGMGNIDSGGRCS